MVAACVINTPDDISVSAATMPHMGGDKVANTPAIDKANAIITVRAPPKRVMSLADKGVITMPIRYTANRLASWPLFKA